MSIVTDMLEVAFSEIAPLQHYSSDVYRVVETQEYAATSSLVDTMEEQSLLESLLDNVKPPYRKGTETRHYLISSPFRYPPLQHGSRFGTILMPSYFYASETTQTALAECAFYRFVFLNDLVEPYTQSIKSEHQSFAVQVDTSQCADLTRVYSPDIVLALTSPNSYTFTQTMGDYLVNQKDVEIIRYTSARTPFNDTQSSSVNVAIASPSVIISDQPTQSVLWSCSSSSATVSFNARGFAPILFQKSDFLVKGVLPQLA